VIAKLSILTKLGFKRLKSFWLQQIKKRKFI